MSLLPNEVKTENIAAGAVTTPKIGDEQVTSAKLKNSAVTAEKLAPGAVTGSKIGDGQIYGSKLRDGAVRAEKIASGAVTTPKIGEQQVTSSRIKDGSISEEKIARNAVTTEKIANASVTPAKLSFTPPSVARPITPAVTTDEIGDAQVTPAKLSFVPLARPLVPPIAAAEIATDAVETAKIKDGAVTPAKASVGFGRYVPRSAAVWDLQSANFTRDGNWHVDGMDISSIVPVGAIAIVLQIEYAQTTSDSYLIFRQNDTRLPIRLNNQVGIQINSFNVIMPIDADRRIDYAVNDSLDVVIGVAVLGWFI